MTTTLWQDFRTITHKGGANHKRPDALLKHYHDLVGEQRLAWTEHLRFDKLLGAGGQGVVYLSERRGADLFTFPLALKIFSPAHYEDEREYLGAMTRMAHVACKVAKIQHDNLLDVHNFIERYRIRVMEMELIDGYDIARLLAPGMLERVKERVDKNRWEFINDVIVTEGPVQPRMKPGIVAAIIRECLGGLAALHREGIIHGDIKPSNIMIKRTGNAKLIDIGSAIDIENRPERISCTPVYAAPETLDRDEITCQSDLASLGYVMVEMLSGKPLFSGIKDFAQLLEAKRVLPQRLESFLPKEVVDSSILLSICKRLTAADPTLRYQQAEQAELQEHGLAEFQRTLVKGNLAIEASDVLRVLLQELD